jgi:low temperature requirement protein LtrA
MATTGAGSGAVGRQRDTSAGPDHPVEARRRVSPLELFFDLVFVFAITQVTALISADPTWQGLWRGMLALGAIWWAWGAYGWLTNTIDPDARLGRLVIFTAMGAMLIVALATPDAFGEASVAFAVAYLVVRALHILAYAYGSSDVSVRAAILALAPTSIAAPALLIVAGFLEGGPQIALWVVALAIDYSGPYVRGVAGLTVSPSHFAERYGLIVIIALGESIVAIGAGATGVEFSPGEVAAAVLGLTIVGTLWWTYFDVVALVAERKLQEARGAARARLARDAYSYLHLPMIAGIVLLAVGIKMTIGRVSQPLDVVPAISLCAGVALYLLAQTAFKLRVMGSITLHRLVPAVACVALIPLATKVDAIHAVAAVAAVMLVMAVYEAIRFRDARARLRAA